MSLRVLLHRLSGLFQKEKLDHELDDEIKAHLEMQIEDNVRRGMSLEEATYAARRAHSCNSSLRSLRISVTSALTVVARNI